MKLRNILKILLVVFVTASAAWAGRNAPPVTVAALDKDTRHARDYPPTLIAKYNLARALDTNLSAEDRVESMRVVRKLNAPIGEGASALMSLAVDPETPAELQVELANYLRDNNYTDLGEFAASSLASGNLTPEVRQSLLTWADGDNNTDMLAEVVKAWANQPVNGSNEANFKDLVEELSGNASWSAALVDGLGTKGFMAKGSALELLTARLTHDEFATMIRNAEPEQTSIATLQTFLKAFDYIPQTREEFIQAVYLFRTEGKGINAVAALYRKWNEDDGYRFNIGDYAIMKGIARDASLINTTRAGLKLADRMSRQDHQPNYKGGEGVASYNARLYEVEDKLSMADLWRIAMVMDLLERPTVRAGMEYIANRDEADTTSAWGGLLFFEGGVPEARRYPPLKTDNANDLTYQPTQRMLDESRDAIGRFTCHFDKTNNARRTGPTQAELDAAREGNYAAVTITRLDENTFTAHYYTPDGEVVSLGTYRFRSAGE